MAQGDWTASISGTVFGARGLVGASNSDSSVDMFAELVCWASHSAGVIGVGVFTTEATLCVSSGVVAIVGVWVACLMTIVRGGLGPRLGLAWISGVGLDVDADCGMSGTSTESLRAGLRRSGT